MISIGFGPENSLKNSGHLIMSASNRKRHLRKVRATNENSKEQSYTQNDNREQDENISELVKSLIFWLSTVCDIGCVKNE